MSARGRWARPPTASPEPPHSPPPPAAQPRQGRWGCAGAAPLRGAASRGRVGAGSRTGPLRPAAGTSGRAPGCRAAPRAGAGAARRPGSSRPPTGRPGTAAARSRADTHRGSPRAPAPAPALGSRGGGGGKSGAGKQAPPSLTYFLPSLNVAPLTYFPTNPLPAGPGPAPRPPIAVPNPPSPPTNGGAAEPGYLPLSASQSERSSRAVLADNPDQSAFGSASR